MEEITPPFRTRTAFLGGESAKFFEVFSTPQAAYTPSLSLRCGFCMLDQVSGFLSGRSWNSPFFGILRRRSLFAEEIDVILNFFLSQP